ncbi:AI-2E family transporter [uncultured Methanobrevibacter sp.]|uniref:AI-2E family transporter n=1 Tax=uncultured Methanobrevibacter sp. TaxID=253161 RepID=UPI0025D9A87A|nr:AI-2E family transporter [uncultured Methanobrevibacter sp.]
MGIDIKSYLNPPVLLVIFLIIISLMFIFPVLNMILLGIILAYLVRPVSQKIRSKLKFSSLSIILAMIVVLIPLILLVAYISYEVYSVAASFMASNYYVNLDQFISQLPIDMGSVNNTVNSSINEIAKYLLSYSVSFLSKFMNISLDLFILVCSVFYFSRDGDKCLNFIRDFVPDDSKGFFDRTCESVKDVLRSIFYGHFLTSVIIGIFGCIGYSLLGYLFGIFLGVLTGILQLIPVFGPWPIYWALFFTDLFSGNYIRAVVVLLFGFFLSTIDMYIRPALSSHYAEIHPLILLVGFLSGPLVYGVVGFIVGPLILGITYTVLDNYRKEYLLGDG